MNDLGYDKQLTTLPLGKATTYPEQYDATQLQAVPRTLNREKLGLTSEALPFKGADMWTGYELSWLNQQGMPQVAIAEFVLPATSPNLVESKSFKLYLNSFNQSRFTDWQTVQRHLTDDLSACAGAPVTVKLFTLAQYTQQPMSEWRGIALDQQSLTFQDDYQYDPDLLQLAASSKTVNETLVSHLLKSNCLITGQPDWGSVLIRYRGAQIDHEALLRYLISFRQHNEFHEQCVERIFMDITTHCQPEALTVYARYTRRGGLDINPFRSNFEPLPTNQRLIRQ